MQKSEFDISKLKIGDKALDFHGKDQNSSRIRWVIPLLAGAFAVVFT